MFLFFIFVGCRALDFAKMQNLITRNSKQALSHLDFYKNKSTQNPKSNKSMKICKKYDYLAQRQ
ncbi:hypothetical protein [Helicobacter sp. T3_23-1059]